jgi:anti-anti-sigma regulatory factor
MGALEPMLTIHEYVNACVLSANEEMTSQNMKDARAAVELAAASSARIVLDLTHTRAVDSWAFTTLMELHDRFGSRLAIVVPPHFRRAFALLEPLSGILFASVDEAAHA